MTVMTPTYKNTYPNSQNVFWKNPKWVPFPYKKPPKVKRPYSISRKEREAAVARREANRKKRIKERERERRAEKDQIKGRDNSTDPEDPATPSEGPYPDWDKRGGWKAAPIAGMAPQDGIIPGAPPEIAVPFGWHIRNQGVADPDTVSTPGTYKRLDTEFDPLERMLKVKDKAWPPETWPDGMPDYVLRLGPSFNDYYTRGNPDWFTDYTDEFDTVEGVGKFSEDTEQMHVYMAEICLMYDGTTPAAGPGPSFPIEPVGGYNRLPPVRTGITAPWAEPPKVFAFADDGNSDTPQKGKDEKYSDRKKRNSAVAAALATAVDVGSEAAEVYEILDRWLSDLPGAHRSVTGRGTKAYSRGVEGTWEKMNDVVWSEVTFEDYLDLLVDLGFNALEDRIVGPVLGEISKELRKHNLTGFNIGTQFPGL